MKSLKMKPDTSFKVALVVDNPTRDLPGLVLLAMQLAQQNITSYLVPMNLQARELWTLMPNLVLINYLRLNNEPFVQHLVNAGLHVGVLDTEGGVVRSLEDYTQYMAKDDATRHAVDFICSWGSVFAEYAVVQGWFTEAQMHITGHPRFDFYATPWKQVVLQNADHVTALPAPMVLINGNFTLYNPAFKTREEEARMYVERFGYHEDVIRAWQENQEQAIQGLTSLANRLASAFPSVTFVYRPHPFEKMETYKDLLNLSADNLHLIRKGTVDAWILRSVAVIQRGCTTSIEAGIAQVPSLSPTWLPLQFDMGQVEAVSVPFQTEEELIDYLEKLLNGSQQPPERVASTVDMVIGKWYYRIDGQAHERVAAIVSETLKLKGSSTHLDEAYCRQGAYGLLDFEDSWKNYVRGVVRRFLNLPIDWSIRLWRNISLGSWWDKSQKRYGVEDVQALVDAIQDVARGENLGWQPVKVDKAQDRDVYHFGYLRGRSICLTLTDKSELLPSLKE